MTTFLHGTLLTGVFRFVERPEEGVFPSLIWAAKCVAAWICVFVALILLFGVTVAGGMGLYRHYWDTPHRQYERCVAEYNRYEHGPFNATLEMACGQAR